MRRPSGGVRLRRPRSSSGLFAVPLPDRPAASIGLIMAFGSGVLISAVAFDLVEEAVNTTRTHGWPSYRDLRRLRHVLRWGDWLIDRSERRTGRTRRGAAEGSPLAIVLGTVLDGVPELMVIGLTIPGRRGGRRLPDGRLHLEPARGDPSTAGLLEERLEDGCGSSWMWVGIALGLGARLAGGLRRVSRTRPSNVVAFVLAFAAGAILTMLADTMMPEAFEHGGTSSPAW